MVHLLRAGPRDIQMNETLSWLFGVMMRKAKSTEQSNVTAGMEEIQEDFSEEEVPK